MTLAERTRSAGAAGIDEAIASLLAAAPGAPGPSLVSATMPVDEVDPLALFAAATTAGEEVSLWLQAGAEMALVGIGSATRVEAAGARRFEDVSKAWVDLLKGARLTGPAGVHGSGPLLLGGFSFEPGTPRSTAWRGFEAASLVLPELLLTLTNGGAWLTASLVEGPADAGAGAMESRRIGQRWARLVDAAGTVTTPPATEVLRVTAQRPSATEWRDSVARLAGAVGRGRIDKAVLARRVDLEAPSDVDVPAVLRRLSASAPESTVFAITRGSRSFVGATPERLVRLNGRDFETVAMAGSARRTGADDADAALAATLLDSDKELEEHAVVVRMLRETLGPISDELDIDPGPRVVRLRHVQHLATTLSGRLREAGGVLPLVAALHPTPAVGGTPSDLALELIAEEEGQERGWYAGPVGWVDRSGDGEFVVALRSGVVEGPRATLFAGCGIVADSDPDREWDESSSKLLALGSALGRIEP